MTGQRHRPPGFNVPEKMNRPEGTVVATGAGFATVSVEAAAVCARCAAGRGCGAGLLQKGRTRVMQVGIAAGLELEAGDRVRLELAPDRLVRAAWLAYGLPLCAMVLAVALAARVLAPAQDFALVMVGALGLLVGFFAGRRKLAGGDCLRRLTPVACERVAGRTERHGARRGTGVES
jgi:sigma-E factor negative regulatory protein RseC